MDVHSERREQNFQTRKDLAFNLSSWDFPVIDFRLVNVALLCCIRLDTMRGVLAT